MTDDSLQEPILLQDDWQFVVDANPEKQKSPSLLNLIAGAGLICLAIALFVISIKADVDPITLQMSTTAPILLGIGLIARYFLMSNTDDANPVVITQQGIHIEHPKKPIQRTWQQVGYSKVESDAFADRKVIKLYDLRGKLITQVSDKVNQFDRLVELVEQMISQANPNAADAIALKKQRKTAYLLIVFGTCFLAAAIFLFYDYQSMLRAEQLLKTKAITGNAHILRHFTAPNGWTRRIEYRITTPEGLTADHNVQVEPEVWEMLHENGIVPVNYIPDEPSISRLVTGQILDDMQKPSPQLLLVIIAGFGIAGVFLFIGFIAWLGWDISQDSKTGKFKIRRLKKPTQSADEKVL